MLFFLDFLITADQELELNELTDLFKYNALIRGQ